MPARGLFIFVFIIQVLLYFLIFSDVFSQEYSYQHYTVKDGLVQNQVIIMFQDSKGYLWLGTKGGVSRFDGFKFKNYTVNDGLLSNQIFRIFEDAEGGINFCSIIGVSRLQDEEFVTTIINDSIPPGEGIEIIPKYTSKEFCILNRANIPVYNGSYDSTLIHFLSGLPFKPNGTILFEEKFNKFWIRDYENNLYSVSNNNLTLFAENFYGRTIQDKSGSVYTFNRNLLYKPDTINNQLYLIHRFQDEKVLTLYDFDYNNNAYFGLNQKKILVFDGIKTWEYKKKFNYINGILIDTENSLWIATETGFYKKISNAFENYTTETGSNEYVWSIVEDTQQNIWFASYGDGLCKLNKKYIERINDYKSFFNYSRTGYFYTGAILASNSKLYFPVRGKGVLQYDGHDFSIIPGIPEVSALDVYDDSLNNNLLVASTAGLVVLENYKTPVLYEKDFIQSRKFIKTIAQDKFGLYWLGGEYMLNTFDGETFTEFPNEQFDYNHGAISIYLDYKKNLWLGTTAGLYFFDYKEFRRIAKNELKSQVVSFVELDSSKLVMGVSTGLAIFDLKRFYENSEENIEILDDSKGFLGFDCIRNGILKDSENNIWVAASDRVVKFYPNRLNPDTKNPDIFIQTITAKGSKPDEDRIVNLSSSIDTIVTSIRNFLRID